MPPLDQRPFFLLVGVLFAISSSSISALSTTGSLLKVDRAASASLFHVNDDYRDQLVVGDGGCHYYDAPTKSNKVTTAIETSPGCSRRRRVLSLMYTSLLLPLDIAWAATAASDIIEAEPKECQNGRIVSESAVPGAYQQTCMNLDERSVRLESLSLPGDDNINIVTVYQGTNDAGGMAGRTGVAVWNSGILLTRLLDKLNQINPSIFKNKTIMELGCGTALASIAIAKLALGGGGRGSDVASSSSSSSSSIIIATDANSEVLALAQRNIERNNLVDVAKTVALQWGLLDATEYESSADVIIGSDLTYNSGSWVVLAETMSTILKPEGILIYLTLGHSGFNVGGELGGFLSVAENCGLRLLNKDSSEWIDSIGSRSIDDLLASVITPDEKVAIDANGGVRVVVLGKKTYGRKG